jgi:hypothetical protein
MVILNAPYQVERIEILGTYAMQKECVEEVKRAVGLQFSQDASFGCIKIEGIHEA